MNRAPALLRRPSPPCTLHWITIPLHLLPLAPLQPIPDVSSVALLPAKDLQLSDQQRLQVAGWGTTETGRPSNVLQ